MAIKRKYDALQTPNGELVSRPAPGTRAFVSGKAVRDGLATGTRQALVSFHQQILTPHFKLPLAITNPSVVIIQHYLEVSPTCDEVFRAWQDGDKGKNDKQVEAAVLLLAQIIRILTPISFFRTAVIGLIDKLLQSQEPWRSLLNRMIQTDKRDQNLAGLALAAAAINVEPPEPASLVGHGSLGRHAGKVWAMLVEGGTAKGLGRLLGMRRRNKEGVAEYKDADPMDKPDIRHLCIDLICPVLALPAFHAYSKPILRQLYSNLPVDPPRTIYRVLTAIWMAISHPSAGQSRRVALILLDEHAIEHFLSLLDRDEVEAGTGKTVAQLVDAFLEAATATPGLGICFRDEGWYPRRQERAGADAAGEERDQVGNREERVRRGLHNRILSNVVRKLGSKVVDDKGRKGAWVTKVLQACPEIVAGYWAHSALAIEPRLNARWIAAMAYIGRLVALPCPPLETFRRTQQRGIEDSSNAPPRPHPPTVEIVVESVLPAPLTRQHLTKGLSHADGLIQLVTAQALARCLQKLEIVQNLLLELEEEAQMEPSSSAENPWARMRRALEMECRRRAPEILVIIAFAQKAATMAPSDSDADSELENDSTRALANKSAMLTEVALRLFGLYYRTMPSISAETRFDVGRLLVSSSSVKAERRERREARSGSIVSETGSLRSVGTAGTAGMGGGFGYARGDVEGFEALSQVHVVQLLSEVKDWQWANKAAGSQYTYLYHVLQLHLTTRQPIAQKMTTSLIQSLLLPTLLFEHDHAELEIWLAALPRLAESTPAGTIQQVHLLSFIDDSVRRCTKTPYRYLEDAEAVIPDYFHWDRRDEMPSPALMTMLEQLRAKVLGMHIASDAAVVVINYLRRVLPGLLGKQRDLRFVDALVGRLEGMEVEAKEKGPIRPGLQEAVEVIRSDMDVLYGRASKSDILEGHADLTDAKEFNAKSFEQICLYSTSADWPKVTRRRLATLLKSSSDDTVSRNGRFAVHLLAAEPHSSDSGRQRTLLAIISDCLESLPASPARTRLQTAIFDAEWFSERYCTVSGDSYREELDRIVCSLASDDAGHQAMAEAIIMRLADTILADKKSVSVESNLTKLRAWTRFLAPDQARSILGKLVKRPKRLAGLSPRVKEAVAGIISATQDVTVVFGCFSDFLPIGILGPYEELLKAYSETRRHGAECPPIAIDANIVAGLMKTGTDQAFKILEALVECLPAAVEALWKAIDNDPEILNDPRGLPTIATLLYTTMMSTERYQARTLTRIAFTALISLDTATEVRNAAIASLVAIVDVHAEEVMVIASGLITLPNYGSSFARLGSVLAQRVTTKADPLIRHLTSIGLQYATRHCSDDGHLTSHDLEMLTDLTCIVRTRSEIPLDLPLVEPLVTAVVQDRLDVDEAIELVAVLCRRCELKASFVRHHLQLVFASTTYKVLTPPSAASGSRSSFSALLVALFTASQYASCQPNFIEPLLPLYRGTLALADRRILSLFQLFEKQRKVSSASVLRHWSASGTVSTRGLDALLSLDPGRVMATCRAFPLRRALTDARGGPSRETGGHEIDDLDPTFGLGLDEAQAEALYDPAFVLALLASTLSAGDIRGLDWVEILRSNVLGLAICALASINEGMRGLAGSVLAATERAITVTAFYERDQLLHTLQLLRHAIPAPSDNQYHSGSTYPAASEGTARAPPRLPTLPTLFLANVLLAQARPGHFLYPLTSHFLLQRPTFDLFDVPMLYSMLYASGEGFRRERSWMVRFLKDGMRGEADWRISQRRGTWSLLATLYYSNTDPAYRRLILQAMNSFTHIPLAARSLVFHSGFVSWVQMQWDESYRRPSRNAEEERTRLLELVENVVVACAALELEQDLAAKSGVDLGDGGGLHGDRKVAAAGKKRRSDTARVWVMDAEAFLRKAIANADPARLEVLARLALRLSLVPAPNPTSPDSSVLPSPASTLLPPLVERVKALDPNAKAGGAVSASTIESLFRVGLAVREEDLKRRCASLGGNAAGEDDLVKAIEEIGWRAGRLEGRLGEWVRREQRMARWEFYRAGSSKTAGKGLGRRDDPRAIQ